MSVRKQVRELAQTIALAVVIFLIARSLVQTFRVEQHSMEPTILDGQYVLVNRLAYLPVFLRESAVERQVLPAVGRVGILGAPERGDIVIFYDPRFSDMHLVKRVVGLPGETVEVRGGRVLINGQAIDEPYLKRAINYRFASRRLGTEEVFLLGDNRDNSYDSHLFGPVPVEAIVGRAIVLGLSPGALVERFQHAAGQALNRP